MTPSVSSSPAPARSEGGNRGRFWAWLPAILLVGLIGTQLIVLANVLEDPAHAVEPEYYDKALHWDDMAAERRESAALGWDAELSVRQDSAELQVRLRHSSGEPVTRAHVEMVAFHNARAARRAQLLAKEGERGVYSAPLPKLPPGLWVVEVRATHRADVFRQELRMQVGANQLPGARRP